MTDHVKDSPSPLAIHVANRLREIAGRKEPPKIAQDAGFRSPNMLNMIASGEAKLPLDRVEKLASALECDANELMRLALSQFMEDRVVRLILAAGASELKTDLDQLGTWLIALATNLRLALDAMDRTTGAAHALSALVSTDFDRVDHLRIEIEKRGTALIGYPTNRSQTAADA